MEKKGEKLECKEEKGGNAGRNGKKKGGGRSRGTRGREKKNRKKKR